MASHIKGSAEIRLLNIVGGAVAVTPEHIAAMVGRIPKGKGTTKNVKTPS